MRPLLPAALGLAFLVGVVACSAPANTQAQASAQPAATDSASPDDTSSPDDGSNNSNSSDQTSWGEVGLPDGCEATQFFETSKDAADYLVCKNGKLYKYGS